MKKYLKEIKLQSLVLDYSILYCEAKFLPIIGEKHIAAMPYEIILEDKEATMLHGRFRYALYCPELKMGTFTKIMSTPGNVEDFWKL
jgi:hypothetical protein